MHNGLSAWHNRKKEEARNTSNVCVTQLPVRSQLENKAACFPAKVPSGIRGYIHKVGTSGRFSIYVYLGKIHVGIRAERYL